ncbi:MAG: hypothetical protein QG670_168 [Thermoproteota archaeon]|nr:hypothetical protein [Thermoproteota archaeon]
MSEEINNIVNSPTIIVSLLIPLGESDFKKVLKQLQGDRSQIAHGRGNEVENIEKKITFLHGLVYAILTKIFTKDRS